MAGVQCTRSASSATSDHMPVKLSAAMPPELRARVESILSDRAARRRKFLQWQNDAKPDATTSEDLWRQHLEPLEFAVLREKHTEPRGGEYDGFFPAEGHFACRGCGKPLYHSTSKFRSGCGWPAFDKCFRNSVSIAEDKTLEPMRIEISCAGCDGHLGHVFAGERFTPANERHCVNSVSVLYVDGPPSSPLAEETVCSMKKLAHIRRA